MDPKNNEMNAICMLRTVNNKHARQEKLFNIILWLEESYYCYVFQLI